MNDDRTYHFEEKLAVSRGTRCNSHCDTIRKHLDGCVEVVEAEVALDKKGIDYLARLQSGRHVTIDLKTREPGCSKYWSRCPETGKPEPELALETWSVVPENGQAGKVGWTLDDAKLTDYTLHVFDEADTDDVVLLPFILLRPAFRKQRQAWMQTYKVDRQKSARGGSRWRSECVFVPVTVVLSAIKPEMWQQLLPQKYAGNFGPQREPLADDPDLDAELFAMPYEEYVAHQQQATREPNQ